MKTYNILRYGLMKRLRIFKPLRLSIALTMKCNLRCPYCSVEMAQGKIPKYKESTLDELKHFVKVRFPYRKFLNEIKLTGGSPELHPNFLEFTNWLLDEGYFIMIFTNLMRPDILMKLKRTYRLMFVASYHHTKDWESMSKEQYISYYNLIKRYYRIIVDEVGDEPEDKWLPFSRLKAELTDEDMKANYVMLRVPPDLSAGYWNCWDVYKKH